MSSIDSPLDGDAESGMRLRQVRLANGQTLRQVADIAKVSEGFLSQVERGVTTASIASLRRITDALGIDMSELFSGTWPPEPAVLRRAARPRIDFGVRGHKYLLTPKRSRSLEVFMGEFGAHGSTGEEPYSHGNSDELLIVLQGEVRLVLGDDMHLLGTDDSIMYPSSTPHKLEEQLGAPAKVLWVISPPSSPHRDE
jgi:transcriptional regulator with XRE-family HTH domain